MPTFPIRGVGEIGLIADLSPQDLPLNAWTSVKNVRFAEGSLSRYSVFKNLSDTYSYTKNPVGIFESGGSGDQGYVTTIFADGTMEEYYGGVVTPVTPLGALGTSNNQSTVAYLGGITYVNREAFIPVYREFPTDGVFTAIPDWPTTDHCVSLRSYKDYLIALNVTKSGTNYSGMVKWSDAAQVGAPPSNWDVTNPASAAGENVINDLMGPLVDGLSLGDSFIIYGETQTFRMDFIGQPFIFNIDKIFDDQGAIGTNCAVEVDNKHYVFGQSDIYLHDGMMKVSIASGKVQDLIYNELDFNLRDRCFVYHDESNSEIGFCYPSSSDDADFLLDQVSGCNRAAIYNYKYNTWTMVSLPSARATCKASLSVSATWEDMPDWETSSQTWQSYAGQKSKNLVLSCSGNDVTLVGNKPYFLDGLVRGRLSNTVDTNVLWDAFAIMAYKDVDEIGAEILGHKMVRSIAPQAKVFSDTDPIQFNVGQSKNPSQDIVWGTERTLYPWNDDKYDTRVNGRYISMSIHLPAGVFATVTGYDIELLQVFGR